MVLAQPLKRLVLSDLHACAHVAISMHEEGERARQVFAAWRKRCWIILRDFNPIHSAKKTKAPLYSTCLNPVYSSPLRGEGNVTILIKTAHKKKKGSKPSENIKTKNTICRRSIVFSKGWQLYENVLSFKQMKQKLNNFNGTKRHLIHLVKAKYHKSTAATGLGVVQKMLSFFVCFG